MKIKHSDAVHLAKRYKCDYCQKEFKSKQNLRQHIKVVHEGLKIECKQCGKTFLKTNHLDDHMNSVHLKKILTCHVCQKTFNHRMTLGVHMKTKHSDVDVHLPCDQCNNTYKYKHSLIEHMEKVHKSSKTVTKPENRPQITIEDDQTQDVEDLYQCEQCNAIFDIEDDFLEHIFTPHESEM